MTKEVKQPLISITCADGWKMAITRSFYNPTLWCLREKGPKITDNWNSVTAMTSAVACEQILWKYVNDFGGIMPFLSPEPTLPNGELV